MSNHMCKNLEVNWLKLVEVLVKNEKKCLWACCGPKRLLLTLLKSTSLICSKNKTKHKQKTVPVLGLEFF